MADKKQNKATPRDNGKSVQNTTGYICSSCGILFKAQKGNFLITGSPLFAGNNGFTNMCKNCMNDLYKKLVGFYDGNIEKAFEHIAIINDWYYSDLVVSATGKEAGDSRIALYPSKLNMSQFRAGNKTYSDTLLERIGKKIDLSETTDSPKEENSIPKEVIRRWGRDFSSEDYEFLEEFFDEWTTYYDCKDKAQQELVKAICVAQLKNRKTQHSEDIKEIEKSMKIFQDLIKTADLKPNRNAENANSIETLGTLIKKLENERPISEPKEEFKDVDFIHKYMETWFFGQLCELVHIPNKNEEEYLLEKEKYKLSPQVLGIDDFAGGSSILESLSARRGKDEPEE